MPAEQKLYVNKHSRILLHFKYKNSTPRIGLSNLNLLIASKLTDGLVERAGAKGKLARGPKA